MHRLVASLVLLAACAASPLVRAQDAAAEDPAALIEQAQAFVNEASGLYLKGDFAAALAALQKAEPLAQKAADPSLPSIRYNIARCYEQLEQWDEALAAYEAYNELPDDPHRKEKAWETMRGLRRKVFGSLAVSCSPAGARVTIFGVIAGAESCPWQSTTVKPGEYTVEIAQAGYESTAQTVVVKAGQSARVEAVLKAVAPPPGAVAPGAVTTAPESDVNVLPWVVMGAGAAALGVGAVFTVNALGTRSDAEELPPGLERDDEVSSFERSRTLSYALYGTGAALAVGGLVWYLLDGGDDDDEASMEAGLQLLPTPNGVEVRF